MVFERIAKKMLLAQIKSTYSSGGESSSDNDAEDNDEKTLKKEVKQSDDEVDDADEQSNSDWLTVDCPFDMGLLLLTRLFFFFIL